MKKVLLFFVFLITSAAALVLSAVIATWLLSQAPDVLGYIVIGALLVIIVWLLWQDFEDLYAKWQERDESR